MIEDMENKDILDKVRMKGMNQGIWLAVQALAYDGRWTQAAEELVSSCGLTEDECRELQEESGSFNDEMLDFINSVFGHEDMINNSITLENIGYHKIGSIFKYNIGSKEVELEVVESSDASCEGFGDQSRHRIPTEDGGGDPGDSSGDAGRERAPCRRVYVYGQDGEHDGYRYLYIKGRG